MAAQPNAFTRAPTTTAASPDIGAPLSNGITLLRKRATLSNQTPSSTITEVPVFATVNEMIDVVDSATFSEAPTAAGVQLHSKLPASFDVSTATLTFDTATDSGVLHKNPFIPPAPSASHSQTLSNGSTDSNAQTTISGPGALGNLNATTSPGDVVGTQTQSAPGIQSSGSPKLGIIIPAVVAPLALILFAGMCICWKIPRRGNRRTPKTAVVSPYRPSVERNTHQVKQQGMPWSLVGDLESPRPPVAINSDSPLRREVGDVNLAGPMGISAVGSSSRLVPPILQPEGIVHTPSTLRESSPDSRGPHMGLVTRIFRRGEGRNSNREQGQGTEGRIITEMNNKLAMMKEKLERLEAVLGESGRRRLSVDGDPVDARTISDRPPEYVSRAGTEVVEKNA